MSDVNRRRFNLLWASAAAAGVLPAPVRGQDWRLGFRTAPAALDSELTLVEGRLPTELAGQFLRVGPAQFERGGERISHWFDGDGMVQRFMFAGGQVTHRGRFVDTDKRRAEQAAGRFLYPGYGFSPATPAGLTRVDDCNTANTNVLPIAGEIWALWEGGSPYRIDPADLGTLGRKAFAGPLDGAPFSAHPRVTAAGDVWNFGALGARCVIWSLAQDGRVRSARPIELPVPSLMHDFAVTRRHIILLLPPLIARDADAESLVDRHDWHPERPLVALVLDKDSLAVVRRHELPARFLFHIGNAWEDGDGTIRMDAFTDPDATFAVITARELATHRQAPPPTAAPTLITLSPDGRGELALLPGAGEFPRIDPRLVGDRHRFTYGIVDGGIAQWDWQTGRRDSLFYGSDIWTEEPVFVPRSGDRGEDDGWLVHTLLNYAHERTELCVLDARRLADGPVARLACPYALPLGFHGDFVRT